MKLPFDSESIPVQLRGGGGFRFENMVAASFLADLLAGERRFLPSISDRVLVVDWQIEAPPLDDVRLTLGDGATTGFLAFSIKKNQQLTRKGFPDDFVRAVWSRWLYPQTGTGTFDRERDYFGLAVGILPDEVQKAWDNLLSQATVGDPHELARRFSSKSVSKIARDLFASLHCPNDLEGSGRCTSIETVRLLRRIRVLHFDFRSEPSKDFARAVEVCRKALASGSFDQAIDLWERLVGIADERRAGGSMDLRSLLGELRDRFQLVALPDYRQDWERLARASKDGLEKVKESLGSSLTLLRFEWLEKIGKHLMPGRHLLLVGASGAGKSALVKIACRRWQKGPVLWLDSTIADVPGLFALEQRLQLRSSLANLLRDTPSQGLLVLDALETWSPQALGVAAGLLEICVTLPHWSVILTTRPDHPRQLLPNLKTRAGLPSDFESLQVPPLEDQELWEAREALTGLRLLFLRPDLKELLRNLKVLDWLATESASREGPEAPSWMRAPDVIDGLWEHWGGTGDDSRLRGELLKKLALREAENLRSGVGSSELGPEELKALRGLEKIELLKVRDEQVFFQHELAGDWARLRVLVERARRSSFTEELAAFARSPRWLPAIRLYGERLLASEDTPTDRWCALYDALPQEPAADDVRGLLLESLFYAGNADEAVESLWPQLIANDGALLKRLLQRFLYSATVPTPEADEVAGDERMAAEIRALVRIPYWPLWKPVLTALDRHRDGVATVAPELGAKVCGLWLRTVPRDWPWRMEAARVAYRISCETQGDETEGQRYRSQGELKQDQAIYEAALLAAPELPEKISDLALKLSGRGKETSDLQKQPRKTRRLPAGSRGLALMDAQRWPLFPDGPRMRVNESFREAVLGPQALSGLIDCRPEIAREVLLACCLRDPGPDFYHRSYGTVGHFGRQGGSPAMFFQGPFLQFLKLDPENGLDAILRLVNQATANWALQENKTCCLVPWGEMSMWAGDVEVFSWYREDLSGLEIVTSALMALEKLLYELVDEGRDIGTILARIFAESRSVAFPGVLVALGKRKPELFTGYLLPLLSAWPLYRWDHIMVEYKERYRSDLMRFVGFGERAFEMVRSWHGLPHRRIPLLDIARDLLLKDPDVASAFESFRERWRSQLSSGTLEFSDDLERLIALFDPANYSSPDITSFEWPEPLREKGEQERSAVQPDLEAECFTEWCRGALREQTQLQPEEAEQVWQAVAELDRLAQERQGFSRWTDAVAAGIAVLLDLSINWIVAEPSRLTWCRERLLRILEIPPTPDLLDDSSNSPTLWQWPSFVAIAGVLLLAIDDDDLLARRIVAEQIVGLGESRISLTLSYAFRERKRLGEDWERMQTLAIFGAALRSVGRPSVAPARALLYSWASRLAQWFIQRKIQPERPNWETLSRVALRLREHLHRKECETSTDEFAPQRFQPVWSADSGFDLSALKAAFAWLPRLNEACDENERQAWIDLHRELLRVAERLHHGLEQSRSIGGYESWVGGLLSDYETWLFTHLAGLIPQLSTAAERESFWRPVFVRSDPAYRSFSRVRTFLDAWFSKGLEAAGKPETFVSCWEEMIRFALFTPDLGGHVDDILGLYWGAAKIKSPQYRTALRRLIPLFEQWAERHLRGARDIQKLGDFLLRPSALDFVCPGMRWLRGALPSLRSGGHDEEQEERLEQTLVNVLRTGWVHFPDPIRGDNALRDDFQYLLSWLAGRGGATALDFQEEVRQSLSATE
ncbi:MAG TPA: ABC transporter ATP-binding protein [Thermoanaerobaculia bacterium]|nr:ABC transporter ATP-binding protein [Thermoanaerobaculia bacterium]